MGLLYRISGVLAGLCCITLLCCRSKGAVQLHRSDCSRRCRRTAVGLLGSVVAVVFVLILGAPRQSSNALRYCTVHSSSQRFAVLQPPSSQRCAIAQQCAAQPSSQSRHYNAAPPAQRKTVCGTARNECTNYCTVLYCDVLLYCNFLLIKVGKPYTMQYSEDGMSVLHLACERMSTIPAMVVAAILRESPSLVDYCPRVGRVAGFTALHTCAVAEAKKRSCQRESDWLRTRRVVDLLLGAGGPKLVNARTSDRRSTALHLAASSRCVELCAYLLRSGFIDPSVRNVSGHNALELLTHVCRDPDVIFEFVDAGFFCKLPRGGSRAFFRHYARSRSPRRSVPETCIEFG